MNTHSPMEERRKAERRQKVKKPKMPKSVKDTLTQMAKDQNPVHQVQPIYDPDEPHVCVHPHTKECPECNNIIAIAHAEGKKVGMTKVHWNEKPHEHDDLTCPDCRNIRIRSNWGVNTIVRYRTHWSWHLFVMALVCFGSFMYYFHPRLVMDPILTRVPDLQCTQFLQPLKQESEDAWLSEQLALTYLDQGRFHKAYVTLARSLKEKK